MRRIIEWAEATSWSLLRRLANAMRYEPSRLDLALAYEASQPGVPASVARWVAAEHARPATERIGGVPYTMLRQLAGVASRMFGPAGSALVRSVSAAVAGGVDRAGSRAWTLPLHAGARPSILVPHPHDVAIVAVDMRGFSRLTASLDDTQYLTELIGAYLSALTRVIERHGGIVHQYTGDGLLALFLPEVVGKPPEAMLTAVVGETGRELHDAFDRLYARWLAEWREGGRVPTPIGLGVGVSYGRATIGLLGPAGKKQFGVVGQPINLAAFLCSQAPAGTVLVDRASFARAGAVVPRAESLRIRSRKQHQRLDAIRLRYGAPRRG